MQHTPVIRRLGFLWLAAALVTVGPAAAPAQAAKLVWSLTQGEPPAEAVQVSADHVATWLEQGQRVVLLSGKVLVGQGLANVRMDRGLLLVDEAGKKKTGVYRLKLYAEGDVYAEDGARNVRAEEGVLELATRGAVKFRSAAGAISQQPATQDELYGRAATELAALPPNLPGQPQLVASGAAAQAPPATVTAAKLGLTPGAVPDPAQGLAGRPTPRSVQDSAFDVAPDNPIQPVRGQAVAPPGPPEVIPIPAPGGPQTVPIPPPAGMPAPPPGVPGVGVPVGARTVTIRPRSSFLGIQARNYALPTGETAVVVSSGIILTVTNADGKGGVLDIESDRLVFWTQGNTQQIFEDLQQSRDQGHRHLEFYLSGHVEIRTQTGKEFRVLRADEVYYDVNRHVAVATKADLEVNDPKLLFPLHIRADELFQINQDLYQGRNGLVTASALPYDPGLALTVNDVSLENRQIMRKTIFGLPVRDRVTGQPIVETQRYVRGRSVFLELEDVPIFYLPYIQGDAEDPLGPLENISVGYNQIFGFQIYTTWDVYDLVGVTAPADSRWRLDVDGLFGRGPALGTTYTTSGADLFGVPNRYGAHVTTWGIYDQGEDQIGGDRGRFLRVGRAAGDVVPVGHPDWRGRFTGRANVQDLPYGFTAQAQLSAISDRNFMEQYFQPEFFNDLNQDTYFYLKQQEGNWAWTGLAQGRSQRWMTTPEWYPRLDGYLLGAKFFDLFTYNAKASAGFGELEVTNEPPFQYEPTDVEMRLGRFDLFQELSLPFTLGAFQVAPYVVADLAYYTDNIDYPPGVIDDPDSLYRIGGAGYPAGEGSGRFYGAGGVRASLPLSRLYADVQSELFNLNGLYHKIVFSANYYNAYSSQSFLNYPQMDRLNDDVSDLTLRTLYPQVPYLYPGKPYLLSYPVFDPQVFAIRNLVLNRIDTRDDVEVLQLGVRQRWQTKRGFPGREHIIDWMTLDLGGSVFPRADRDNFGNYVALLKYDWVWNVGDRTSLVSNGWLEPYDNGARVFNVGTYLDRPDRSSLYLGYRQIDPVDSKSVIASFSYLLSQKYSATASAMYDFGVDSQISTLVFSRTGKDLRFSFGFSYDSILSNFGLVFEVVPNAVGSRLRSPALAGPFGTVSSTTYQGVQ